MNDFLHVHDQAYICVSGYSLSLSLSLSLEHLNFKIAKKNKNGNENLCYLLYFWPYLCYLETSLFMLLDVTILDTDLLYTENFSSFKLSGFRTIVSLNAGNLLLVEDNEPAA